MNPSVNQLKMLFGQRIDRNFLLPSAGHHKRPFTSFLGGARGKTPFEGFFARWPGWGGGGILLTRLWFFFLS